MPHYHFSASLPLQGLLSENEEALPHQPSLDALSESTESCTLGKLILWAAGCYLTTTGGTVTSTHVEIPGGFRVTSTVFNGMYNNLMLGFSKGAVSIDTGSAEADLYQPSYLPFLRGPNLWLFYYKVRHYFSAIFYGFAHLNLYQYHHFLRSLLPAKKQNSESKALG